MSDNTIYIASTVDAGAHHHRAQARRVAAASKINHPLLRDVFGIIVFGMTVDPSPPPETDEMAAHWRDKMTSADRLKFVNDLLKASSRTGRVSPELVLEGVAIVSRAVDERLATQARLNASRLAKRPPVVSPSLNIPMDNPERSEDESITE
jgi:hypothetical protein